MKSFNEHMESLLSHLKNESKFCYLMGDYNINRSDYGKHQDTTYFVDMLHAGSFISCQAIYSCDTKSVYDENDAQNVFSTFLTALLKCYFPKHQVKNAYRTHKAW